jgi:hypothetical protein
MPLPGLRLTALLALVASAALAVPAGAAEFGCPDSADSGSLIRSEGREWTIRQLDEPVGAYVERADDGRRTELVCLGAGGSISAHIENGRCRVVAKAPAVLDTTSPPALGGRRPICMLSQQDGTAAGDCTFVCDGS